MCADTRIDERQMWVHSSHIIYTWRALEWVNAFLSILVVVGAAILEVDKRGVT